MALFCPVLLGLFNNWEWLGRKPLDEIRSNRFGAATWELKIDSCAITLTSKKGKKTVDRQRAAAQSTTISWRYSQLGHFPVLEHHEVLSGALGHTWLEADRNPLASLLHMLCLVPVTFLMPGKQLAYLCLHMRYRDAPRRIPEHTQPCKRGHYWWILLPHCPQHLSSLLTAQWDSERTCRSQPWLK